MSNFKIWNVEVVQTYTSSCTALVWAETDEDASILAKKVLKPDFENAIKSEIKSYSNKLPMEVLNLFEDDYDGILIMPNGNEAENTQEFKSVLTEGQKFVIKQKIWELQGQMRLL